MGKQRKKVIFKKYLECEKKSLRNSQSQTAGRRICDLSAGPRFRRQMAPPAKTLPRPSSVNVPGSGTDWRELSAEPAGRSNVSRSPRVAPVKRTTVCCSRINGVPPKLNVEE